MPLDLFHVGAKWNSVLTLPMDTVNSPGGQHKTLLKADVGGLVSDLRSEAGRKMRTQHWPPATHSAPRSTVGGRGQHCAMACLPGYAHEPAPELGNDDPSALKSRVRTKPHDPPRKSPFGFVKHNPAISTALCHQTCQPELRNRASQYRCPQSSALRSQKSTY